MSQKNPGLLNFPKSVPQSGDGLKGKLRLHAGRMIGGWDRDGGDHSAMIGSHKDP